MARGSTRKALPIQGGGARRKRSGGTRPSAGGRNRALGPNLGRGLAEPLRLAHPAFPLEIVRALSQRGDEICTDFRQVALAGQGQVVGLPGIVAGVVAAEFANFCALAQETSGGILKTALSFLDRGIAKYVCIMGAVTDWSQAQESRKAGHRGMDHAPKAGYWGKALGDLRAVSHHSWMAARHMAVYGTTSRQLGAISVAQRAWTGLRHFC